jgi:hypothetical protein
MHFTVGGVDFTIVFADDKILTKFEDKLQEGVYKLSQTERKFKHLNENKSDSICRR